LLFSYYAIFEDKIMRTAVRSIRLTHTLIDQIEAEASRTKKPSVEIIREALTKYFEHRQMEAAMLKLEQRLTAKIDSHTQHISGDLQKILSLAQPV
jgi:predicted DNA-binding protein